MYKRMRTALTAALAIAAVAVSVGCAQLSSSTSLTPNMQEAVALSAVKDASQNVDTLLKAHKISVADAQAVHDTCAKVITLVKAARGLPAGDGTVASDLTQISELLTTLAPYLTQTGT